MKGYIIYIEPCNPGEIPTYIDIDPFGKPVWSIQMPPRLLTLDQAIYKKMWIDEWNMGFIIVIKEIEL